MDEDSDLKAALAASLKENCDYNDYNVDIALALSKSEQESNKRRREEDSAHLRNKEKDEDEDAALSRAMDLSERSHQLELDEQDAADMSCIEALTASMQEESNRSASEEALRHSQQIKSEECRLGSWDCTTCTYRNKPFASTCSMCGTQPGTHILTFPKMNQLRFGLEIEIIIPNGKADGFTERIIADRLTQMGTKVEFCGYTHATTDHWKIVTDSSITASSSRHLCFELVSPVLCGEQQEGNNETNNNSIESFRNIMQNIRRIGIDTNSSCGFHVHIDATPNTCAVPQLATLHGLTKVCQAFIAFENAFDILVARSSSSKNIERKERAATGNQYCRSNRLVFGASSNRQRWEQIKCCSKFTKQNLVDTINPNNNRYMKLNLTNIVKSNRPSTIEFRHHGGIVDILEAEVWVRLLLRFCEFAAMEEDLTSCCLLWEQATPKDELKALFWFVKCEGLEQFYVLDRKLFGNSRGGSSGGGSGRSCNPIKNEWSCNVCCRKFGSSRSLSQHVDATGHY